MLHNPRVLITDTDELARLCEDLSSASYVAVDTEFMRERTYRADLCLVQISGPDRDARAVDPLSPDVDLAPLFELLANDSIVKVFHAARQDLEIFFQLADRVPAPIFDSQVAAMVCGYGDQVGFATLASTLTGAALDKSSQYSDWSLRPLSERQLRYALDDVVHLCDIYEQLDVKLGENGRREWLSEEMNTLADPMTYQQDPRDAWRRIKRRKARPRSLAILRELAEWRENEAKRLNIPRNRVVRDESLVEIAGSAPRDRKALERTRGLSAGHANGRAGARILAAVERGLAIPRSELPRPEPRPVMPEGASELVALLQALLKLRCSEQRVAQRLVATRSDLEHLVAEPDGESPILNGWRRDLFGEEARMLLRGEVALTGAAGGMKLIRVK